ncbi:MBL fold metallo-hydrolase [Marixanthomonas ophiurae]|uniref:MBL fold metallo-hydrolase n=1 Tax=Marixanthomonas ophiurae TaxID=387659 RepID=A0A3E1QAE3_9FLAO|nr:MBL fold metallo-hydrolase [Marixanthomonas ophiurae]RFN59105.1 MBL fold metallo-hydrolase [Marixanthomonas ophiurae]
MKIKQFEYKPLSHYSYAIISDGKMALVDPERDPMQYYTFAQANNAEIVAVFETHPHADFVSSHLQVHKETGATIYSSEKTGADYPHTSFDDGNTIKMGYITFTAINTPGHSPDSITIQATEGENTALFTGDTLFVGDVGRPDLREKAGHLKAKREELAKMMYNTIQTKFKDLPDSALVYPAHGAGSLCGKGMSADASSSTLGNERIGNWAFKNQTEEQFINHLLNSQPFIPHYFGYNVAINKEGAENLSESIGRIPLQLAVSEKKDDILVVDSRDEAVFKKNHLPESINIMATSETSKFETWLGSIVKPEEEFYVVVDSVEKANSLLNRIAKIGYEKQVKAVLTLGEKKINQSPAFNLSEFKKNPDAFTIVDIRNESEVNERKFFEEALAIPLHQLREHVSEIPTEKPIMVHCAGGYRSAAGSSILETELKNTPVFDLSDAVTQFQN